MSERRQAGGAAGGPMDAAASAALLQHCVGLGESFLHPLRKNGARFRAGLTAQDIAQIQTAQTLFHLSLVLPALLYYVFRTSDAVPRFPSTISW